MSTLNNIYILVSLQKTTIKLPLADLSSETTAVAGQSAYMLQCAFKISGTEPIFNWGLKNEGWLCEFVGRSGTAY